MGFLSRWTVLVMFTLGLAPAGALAASYGPGDTGVVNVSASPGYAEGEEPLSVDPNDPAHLVTVANVFQANLPAPLDRVFGGGGFQDTRVYSSQDGGAHWTTRKLDQGGLGTLTAPVPESEGFSPEFSDAFNVLNTDAASIWDGHGNAYYETGDVHGIHHGGDEVATVWRSSDGGRTWGPPDGYAAVRVSEEGDELDRPWLAADTSGGPYDGTVYITFETSPFVDDPPKVFVKRSTDQGRTWSATVRVD
ncbi:MAG TPA: sialidase family protein, partial [Solirubrobacteraceae bacterium]